LKVKAVFTAMSIAEHFRDEGKQVLLMVDSITRLAMAQREIGLAAGEPPTTRGYTPSVFGLLPRLLERAGPGEKGSITAICTVLVEGDDMEDPVADIVRSIVDGHVVLSRKLASHGHYPAIDILQSVSRTMASTVSQDQVAWAGRIRDLLATWTENEELIRLGAYRKGTDAEVDLAIQTRPELEKFLCQGVEERAGFNRTKQIMKRLGNKRARAATKSASRN
jgi:flagellum-specific ATP synthase